MSLRKYDFLQLTSERLTLHEKARQHNRICLHKRLYYLNYFDSYVLVGISLKE